MNDLPDAAAAAGGGGPPPPFVAAGTKYPQLGPQPHERTTYKCKQ